MRSLNYEERIKALDLATLSERRRRGDMIQIFTIVHISYKMEMNNNLSSQQNQTRGHCFFKYHREFS